MLAVEPKAFRTLLFLLHNPQRLITKEELLSTVWGDAAVTEGSLTRCIWLLRTALGDDIHQPRYIKTVATVGYRFVCKVEVSEDMHGGAGAGRLAGRRWWQQTAGTQRSGRGRGDPEFSAMVAACRFRSRRVPHCHDLVPAPPAAPAPHLEICPDHPRRSQEVARRSRRKQDICERVYAEFH